MNLSWKQYLLNLNAQLLAKQDFPVSAHDADMPRNFSYPITHLAVLRVSGEDAATFLQGQCTCDIHELNEKNSRFGAFCNAKGRVITTFMLLKSHQDWLLIVPSELLADIQSRLQRYILRAKVQLTDGSAEYCLLGFSCERPTPFNLPEHRLDVLEQPAIIVRLEEQSSRYLLVAECNAPVQNWPDDFTAQREVDWRLLDIQAGIPWLCKSTSEEYIPQMLNLDQLGGISFTKGCYTGQEIVARTHYLGKAKRRMFTAVVDAISEAPPLNSAIIDQASGETVGTVLAAHISSQQCTLSVVLATEARQLSTLTLQDQPLTPLVFL
ncbi:MAG: folate-binding protein [Methylococcales bacterium]|nr:folate-binding protein [Methylococcales bacterium]